MKMNKRRIAVIAAGVGTLGAVTALGLGGTSALYTSQADGQQNSIESGTIVLTKNAVKTVDLNLTGFMPGDTSPKSKYWLDYSGEDAFVGLDLTITSTADKPCPAYVGGASSISPAALVASCTGTGTAPMFNGDPTSGSLDLSILPENGVTAHQLFNPGDLEPGTQCDADVAGVVTCTVERNNVIVPPGYMSTPITADELAWHDGSSDWITVQAALPLAAPNAFQGSTVGIDLTAHAVQYANNHVPVAGFEGILPNGISGTGSQAPVHFPDNF
jgi:predicted ribosomally synthesized peptide with SipW-like signal peptide